MQNKDQAMKIIMLSKEVEQLQYLILIINVRKKF
jgi:hypothetical protein